MKYRMEIAMLFKRWFGVFILGCLIAFSATAANAGMSLSPEGGADESEAVPQSVPQPAAPITPAVPAAKTDGDPAKWAPLVKRLKADGFDPARLQELFSRPEAAYNVDAMGDKLTTLYMRKFGSKLVREIQNELMRLGYYPGPADGRLGRMAKWSVKAYKEAAGLPVNTSVSLDLLQRLRADKTHAPAGFAFPVFTTEQVYESVMRPERLAEGEAFYRDNFDALKKVRETYGVPEDVAAGLVTVETRAGNYLGSESALVNLASMSLAGDYDYVSEVFDYEAPNGGQTAWLRAKAREKGDWAYKELKALLEYSARIGRDPLTMPGSIYGAIGICQFMPTNAVRYTVDGDGDGKADLFNVADALQSMGNFLTVIGWDKNMTEAKMRKTLRRYNQSDVYVNTILAVAAHLRKTAAAGKTGS